MEEKNTKFKREVRLKIEGELLNKVFDLMSFYKINSIQKLIKHLIDIHDANTSS